MLRSRRDVSTTSTSTRQEPSLLDADTKKGQKKKSTVNNLTSVFFGAMLLLSFLLFLMGHGANVHTDKSVGSGLRSSSSSSGHAARKSLFSDTTNQAKSVKDKKGKVMHHAITSVKQNDLAGLVDDELPSDGSPITFEQAIKGRERIVAILNDAGVSDMDPETILKLPKWSSVTKLYGEGPVVYGMETCAKFRETAALDDASIGTAGIFNTGTNPFAMYVEANCVMSHNTHDKHGGMRWQV